MSTIYYGIEKMKMPKREYAYHKIRDAITYGEFKPGERLIEKNLCEIFKCGRTPVREALSQLHIEGYLNFVPNKGLTITRMSSRDVKEIYEVIAALEGVATEMATKNLNKEDEERIELIHNGLERACNSNNHKKWMDKNAIFHEYLVTASGNKFLSSLIRSLRNRIYRHRLISLTMPDSLKIYLSAHEEILKNILKKDRKKAGRAMQRHVLAVANNLIEFLNKIQEF